MPCDAAPATVVLARISMLVIGLGFVGCGTDVDQSVPVSQTKPRDKSQEKQMIAPSAEESRNVDPQISIDQDDERVHSERLDLLGTWKMGVVLIDGKGDVVEDPANCVITETTITMRLPAGTVLQLPYSLDPTTTPKYIDWGEANNRMRSIYDLDGNILKWYFNPPGEPRPTRAETGRELGAAKYLVGLIRIPPR